MHKILIALFIVLFFIYIFRSRTTSTSYQQPSVSTSTTRYVRVVDNDPDVYVRRGYGGCAGTRYGCCPDRITPKVDYIGSNCIF